MGYLISAHILPGERDFGALHQLPPSIDYAAYFHEGVRCYLLDVYASRRPPQYPFCSILPAADIPLELSAELGVLNEFYQVLARLNRANSFKRSYINFALLLSQKLDSDILSFVADDDDLDFACTVRGGVLNRLHFRRADLLVTYSENGLLIEPLYPEEEEDVEWLTDLDFLKKAIPSAVIRERTLPMPTLLHSLVTREVAEFTGAPQPILGLGSFDPPEDEAQRRKVAQR